MKKILLILWLFFFSFSQTSASECSRSCKISDGPAPVLTEYISNLHTVRDNIIDIAYDADPVWDGNSVKELLLQRLNATMSFSDYFWSFEYYVDLRLDNAFPSQVKRDHDLILGENKRLRGLLKSISNKTSINGDICRWVTNCSLNSLTTSRALVELITNNQEILRFYRGFITGSAQTWNTAFILTWNNFTAEMANYYNTATLNACSKCQWEFWDVLDTVTNISAMFDEAKQSTKVWQDTWNLLWSWGSTPEYQNLEKDLLSDYLKSSWVSIEQADIMLWNLERYNNWGLAGINPIKNSIKEFKTAAQSFDASLRESFEELVGEEESVPYAELTRINTQVRSSQDIRSAISTVYNDELPFAYSQDTKTQSLQARILKMHFSLVRTANLLKTKIPDAEKICNKQWTWLGRCDFDLILR